MLSILMSTAMNTFDTKKKREYKFAKLDVVF